MVRCWVISRTLALNGSFSTALVIDIMTDPIVSMVLARSFLPSIVEALTEVRRPTKIGIKVPKYCWKSSLMTSAMVPISERTST